MSVMNVPPDIIGGEPPHGFHFQVRSHEFPLTDAIRQYAIDHIGARLAKHARSIQSVTVRFDDVNGTKKGEDKCCRIEVVMRRGNPIITEEIDQDLRAAIDRAAHRSELAATRALERSRAIPRQRGHKMVRNRKILH
jgi:ribosome-associated translation inhibitor RaiA